MTKPNKAEVMLFAYIYNTATAPLGKKFGKSEDEIADKTLEAIESGKKQCDIAHFRRIMMAAMERRHNVSKI